MHSQILYSLSRVQYFIALTKNRVHFPIYWEWKQRQRCKLMKTEYTEGISKEEYITDINWYSKTGKWYWNDNIKSILLYSSLYDGVLPMLYEEESPWKGQSVRTPALATVPPRASLRLSTDPCNQTHTFSNCNIKYNIHLTWLSPTGSF